MPAFHADPYPAAQARKEALGALAAMMLGHRDRIRAAMREDFGAHPDLFTDLIEVLGVASRAAYAIENLDTWMAEEERPADPAIYGKRPGRASGTSPREWSATSSRGTFRSTCPPGR